MLRALPYSSDEREGPGRQSCGYSERAGSGQRLSDGALQRHGTCLSTVTASRWSTPSATCRPDRHCQNTRPVMPGVGFMTNLMQSLYLQIAPENNKENQFIDFRLITTSKEKPRFSLLVNNRTPGHAGRFLYARSGGPGVGLSPNSARTLATVSSRLASCMPSLRSACSSENRYWALVPSGPLARAISGR